MGKTINIRPTTSVYATYKNIKYDPWTAIAEFVDNSTQSYYDNIVRLEATKYWDGLEVKVNYERSSTNGDRLTITDNAFGMDFNDFNEFKKDDTMQLQIHRIEDTNTGVIRETLI